MKKNKLYRIKTGIIFALIVLIFVPTASAQTAQEPEREAPLLIAPGFGYSFGGYREETDSSINRYYTLPTYIIEMNINTANFLHHINIGFLMGENSDTVAGHLQEKYNPYPYSSMNAGIEYALGYRLWGDDTFPGYLGGNFRTDVLLITETLEIAKITAILSLGLHATQRWYINSQHSLSLSLGIPLLAYAVRPPFPGVDEVFEKFIVDGNPLGILTTGGFGSVHNYWALFGNLRYKFQFTSLFALNAGLGFDLSRVNFPQPRIDAVFRLRAGIAFTF